MICRTILGMAVALVVATSAQASVEISADPTKNMNCTGGVCSPTAKKAVLNSTDLANMLASGDVKVVTGAGAVTITVYQSFSWTSNHRLTLDAQVTVSFRAPVVVAGQGAVTIITNDGGTGGDLIFFPGSSLDFWDLGSSLIINGVTYRLINDIKVLGNEIAANPNGQYALASNYDASSSRAYKKNPVQTIFTGQFEGLGHEVSNLTIKNHALQADIGFFQELGYSAVVRDFGVQNLQIVTGNQPNVVGGIAALSYGKLIGCSAGGTFQVYGNPGGVGGLVGATYGAISRSNASVDIVIHGYDSAVGGLAGFAYGPIDHSFANGSISGKGVGDQTGGLAGWSGGLVSFSHASVDISTNENEVGGLLGANLGGVEYSYATGNIKELLACSNFCTRYAGGLAGVSWQAKIENSYATGSVTAGDDTIVGGLVGSYSQIKQQPTVASSYAIGALTSSSFAGGFFGTGRVDLSVTDGYWDIDTTGTDKAEAQKKYANGISGLTDAQFKAGLPSGFDPAIWGQSANINNGYPYLLANPPPQ